MTQKPNTRAFLFDDISDSSKPALKRKAVHELRLPFVLKPFVLKRICGSGY
ncbi:hypothetical protein [Methanimicrococcus hacksteinii]|uniref:hypothetical protein n=1 Tax=Methanimicrococcus hacksteinii TaxID=3028293 RepID=UPI00298F11EA|nr:hypothetical protein [Methanimicrococcus sp. At1]